MFQNHDNNKLTSPRFFSTDSNASKGPNRAGGSILPDGAQFIHPSDTNRGGSHDPILPWGLRIYLNAT